MNMGNKLALTLLVAALSIPAQGFAANQADGTKPAPKKREYIAPADCKLKAKVLVASAGEKRKQAHAERGITGERITHNPEAAHEHGKSDR